MVAAAVAMPALVVQLMVAELHYQNRAALSHSAQRGWKSTTAAERSALPVLLNGCARVLVL